MPSFENLRWNSKCQLNSPPQNPHLLTDVKNDQFLLIVGMQRKIIKFKVLFYASKKGHSSKIFSLPLVFVFPLKHYEQGRVSREKHMCLVLF